MNLLNILGGDLFIHADLWINFFGRFVTNIITTFILIRFIYYPKNGQLKYVFSFFMMGLMIFFISSSLDKINLSMGFAFGLFAIFGIIRYRTPTVELREITYLFLIIGISVINALVDYTIADWFGILIANFLVLIFTYLMESYKPQKVIKKKMLVFTPSNFKNITDEEWLSNEIRLATGINILKIEISKINVTKKEVIVYIYYLVKKKEGWPS